MTEFIAYYTHTKQKHGDGEALIVDNSRNEMFCFDTQCTFDGINQDITNTNQRVAAGTVKRIHKFELAEQCKDNYMYIFECIPANNSLETRYVKISEREFGTSAMVRKLRTEGCIVFYGKQSDGKAAKLIADWIVAHGEIEKMYLPYHSGWESSKYYYTSEPCLLDNMDFPYLKNLLLSDNNISTDNALHTVFNTIENTSAFNSCMLFILMIYGMLYTVFSGLGYRIKRIINLSGKMADKAAQFMKIFNKDNTHFVGLNNNVPSLRKVISNSKDEVLILKGRVNTDKAQLLCDIFCHDISPNIPINGKSFQLISQSLCVVISNCLSDIVPLDLMWEFNIEQFSAEIDVATFGVAMEYLISEAEKYNSENKFYEVTQKYANQCPNNLGETEREEFIILNTVYDFIRASFEKYGLNTDELISESDSHNFISEFISDNRFEMDYNTIIRKLRNMLIDTALNMPSEKYTAGMQLDSSNGTLPLLYGKDVMYIYRDTFASMIQNNFPDGISVKQLLNALYDEDALVCNNGNSVRLSVRFKDNKSQRSDWIGVKREFFESQFQLPLFPDSEMALEAAYKPIYLGNDISGRYVYLPLNSNALINNHIGITGDSGTGKSNTTIHLIIELIRKDIPAIIIDTANSLYNDISGENFQSHIDWQLNTVSVRNDKLPINPFAKHSRSINGKILEKPFDTALRGSNTLADAFGLNDTQKRLIQQIAEPLIIDNNASLESVCKKLGDDNNTTAQACLNRLYTLKQADIFDNSERTIDWYSYAKHRITYFCMDNLPDESFKRAVGEFILSDIWTYIQQYGNENTPFAIVFDEVAKFAISDNSALTKLLKEGRKYGAMCIWNTQSFGTKFDDEQRATLSQAATMLHFDTSEPKEVEYISSRLPDGGKCLSFLKGSGQCIAYGAFCDDKDNTYLKKEMLMKIPLVK